MAHSPNSEPQKRKRDIDDIGNQPVRSHHTPTHSSPQPGISGFINYLPSSNGTHLNLIHGDVDTFSEIIGLIGEYEGVLDRHESLAASLGAKLTGPRLLKGIEKFFDGPIKATPLGPLSPVPEPVSWLDIVSFARANPKEFTLCSMPDGSRCCQFTLKGLQVEITEDDWRLIWSGALERFPLDHPFEEDEIAESATLDILEQRTSMLYKKADEVAARARILHHKLEKRKQDIRRRRKTQDTPTSRLHNSNHEHSQRSAGFGTLHDIHADLLQQFTTASTSPSHSRSASVAATSMRNAGQSSPGPNIIFHQSQFGSSARLHGSTDSGQSNSDTRTEPFRAFITHRIEKLEKGDVITPPCDRCRRLNTACQKHLSACVGCTKKHAKCSWKALTDEEMRQLKQEPRISGVDEDRRVSRDERPELPSLRDSLLKSRGREGEVVHESAEVISEPIVYENGSRLPSQESAPERFKARSADSLDTVQESHSSKRSDLALAPASRTPDQWKSTQIPSISSITSALRQDRATTSTHTETVSR